MDTTGPPYSCFASRRLVAESPNSNLFFYSRFHVILQNSRFISQISFHFFVSFFKFSSHGRVDLAPECPSRQSKIIFRKISAIRLKMVCCMPLSSHKKVPYSKERHRLHAFCHGVPRGFFRACKALDWGRNHASLDSIAGATGRLQENYARSNCAHR